MRAAADVSLDGVLPEQDHGLTLAQLGVGQFLSGGGHSAVGLLESDNAGVVLLAQSGFTQAKCRNLIGQVLGIRAVIRELVGTG